MKFLIQNVSHISISILAAPLPRRMKSQVENIYRPDH